MKIIMRKVSEITPYENNPRRNDEAVDKVAASIKEFGFQQPIVVDADGVIIVGHTRLKAAKQLGMQEVPVVVADGLTPEQVKAYRLADNKTGELAGWDFTALEDELAELAEFDMSAFGFELGIEEEGSYNWFDSRERYEDCDDEDDEYKEFIDKYKPKKTTDDCYTPDNIYEAVADWCADEYGLNPRDFVRPFFPGGDYQNYDYQRGCVVVDNPPFSILSEIIRFYCKNNIRFFLFAPTLTLFAGMCANVTYIAAGAVVTYENGACINTSFVTNLDHVQARTAPGLYREIKRMNDINLKSKHKELQQYNYPDHVITAAMAAKWCKYGVEYKLSKEDCFFIRALDEQKECGKELFGGGFLLSEKAAAEKAAAEKAAAEKAVAEKAVATIWKLSDREWEIVRKLGQENTAQGER